MKKLVFAAVAALTIVSVSNTFAFNNISSASAANIDSTASVDTVTPAQQDTVAPVPSDTTVQK